MAEIDTKNIEIEQDTIEKEQKTEQIKNKYQPLTEEEIHRLFRNEYLTIDDPLYFEKHYNNKRRSKRH